MNTNLIFKTIKKKIIISDKKNKSIINNKILIIIHFLKIYGYDYKNVINDIKLLNKQIIENHNGKILAIFNKYKLNNKLILEILELYNNAIATLRKTKKLKYFYDKKYNKENNDINVKLFNDFLLIKKDIIGKINNSIKSYYNYEIIEFIRNSLLESNYYAK